MSDEPRSRRAARPASKAAGALAKLAELRRSGAKHGAVYDVKEEENVYDVVEESEYADIVAKRRDAGGDFIEDDDGMGYVDVGEEDYWEADREDADADAQRDEPAEKGKKRKKVDKDAKGARKKQLPAVSKAAKQSINKLFSAATAKVTTVRNDPETSQAADALLDDILTDLGDSKPSTSRAHSLAPAGAGTAARPGESFAQLPAGVARAKPRPQPSVAAARPSKTALAGTAASRLSRALRDVPMLDATVKEEDMGYDDHGGNDYNNDYNNDNIDDYGGDAGMDTGMPDDPPPESPSRPGIKAEGAEEPVSTSKAEAATAACGNISDSAEAPTPTANRTVQQLRAQEGTPAGSSTGGGSAPKTPWRTPPPTFAEVATPLTAVAASGWQQHYDDDEAGEGGEDRPDGEVKEEPKEEWVDDGSLPLVDGTLPFFLLDAHEEAATPGTVYLFGKVPNGGQHQSCCAVLEGCMRCIFFVPQPGTFTGAELTRLEAEAAANPGAKGPLLRHLHEQAAALKAEVRAVLAEHGIDKFVIKPVRRNYAFELDSVPHGEQWVLKVRYSAAKPSLPNGLEGEHFVGVFGAQQSVLESVLLKRRIMGPSWISLSCPTRVDASKQVSWCKLEVKVEGHKNVSSKCAGQQEPPPLIVAALNLKTSLHPQANTNEVVAASVVYLPAVNLDRPLSKAAWNSSRSLRHFSVLRKLDGQPFPAGFEAKVQAVNASEMGRRNGGTMLSAQASERSLLMNLLARLRALDADVLVGHNIAAFDLDVLLHRLQHHKVPQWSRVGRLRRSTFPSLGGGGGSFGGGAGPGLMTAMAGRLICDTYLGARELLHEVDYTMATLARIHLGQTRSDLAAADVPGKYEAAPKLMELVQHTESDAWLALSLAMHLNLLPLSRQLSCLSGSLWSRTLQGQRAQRIEMLLLHEFYARKFLLPDKLSGRERERLARRQHAAAHADDGEAFEEVKAGGKKGKAQYAGGLVLEPKKGLYNSIVLLLDFNSLYPSIIQEYNICFTTVRRPKDGSIAPLPEPSHDLAVLPKVIRGLVQRRREVKSLLANERDGVRRQQLDIRQQALKLTANSMYGCLGFSASRFFARPLAELVTAQGRDILQSTVDLVQSSVGLEVIYGDTDSIMVRTDVAKEEEARAMGARVKREVNKRYKLLEIELDAMYKCMLLLKKKKYAAIKLDRDAAGRTVEVKEAKGLDMVRRDWCALAKDCGNYALDEILSGRPCEDVVSAIHARLRQVREKVDAGAVTLDKFVIHKQLTKRPEDYPDAKNQPHVQVALRRAAAHKREGTKQGETVPYIICIEVDEAGQPKDGGAGGLAERAYHREELAANPALRVDVQYYLANQVHPVVSRLCAPIEGTDAARLADCLGLDPAKYHAAAAAGSGMRDALEDALIASTATLDCDARYKDCDPLWLTSADGTRFPFVGVQDVLSGGVAPGDAFAPPDAAATGSGLSAAQVANQVRLRAREAVAKYYEGSLVSDDELMPVNTRNVCLRAQGDAAPGMASPNVASAGHMAAAMSEAALYTQLSHFHRLLDPSLALARLKDDTERLEATRRLAPIREALEAGRKAVEQLRNRCAYRWVSLGSLYNVTATGA